MRRPPPKNWAIAPPRWGTHRTVLYVACAWAAIWFVITKTSMGPGTRESAESLHASSAHRRLLVVIPFTPADVASIKGNLKRWDEVGPICSRSAAGSADMWLYFNRNAAALPPLFAALNDQIEYTRLEACFQRRNVAFANLTDEEDSYPGGISTMFFRLVTGMVNPNELRDYGAMFWMEPDVVPIKSLWLDKLLLEATRDPSFWVKGSAYLGDELDTSAGQDRDWVGHINGNALYRLNDRNLTRFLRIVADREPPGHFWKPFDVSIWKVLHELPYSWHMFQRVANRFVYSDFIQNWSYQITADDVLRTKRNPQTFFLHGKHDSAGNNQFRAKVKKGKANFRRINWDGAVDRSDGICVFIRSHARNLPYAKLAISSVLKHAPGVLEIVVVVPDVDIGVFTHRARPEGSQGDHTGPQPSIVFEAEDALYSDDAMDDEFSTNLQEAYTRSFADVYCKQSDFILHLQSGAVISRKLYRKDLFFEGKPVIRYDRYINRPGAAVLWQRGTAYALGAPAELAFTHASDHVYPKRLFANARAHVERKHKLAYRDFLRTRVGSMFCLEGHCRDDAADGHSEHDLRLLAFSFSAFFGAYLRMAEEHDVSWIPVDRSEYHDHTFVPIIPSFTCQGHPWLARKLDMESRDLDALSVAVLTGSCHDCNAWRTGLNHKVVQYLVMQPQSSA